MSDRRELFTSIFSASRPEVEKALRLQLGDPYHAAALGGNEVGQQILQRETLRLRRAESGKRGAQDIASRLGVL